MRAKWEEKETEIRDAAGGVCREGREGREERKGRKGRKGRNDMIDLLFI